MNIRECQREDLPRVFDLYLSLHETSVPSDRRVVDAVWEKIAGDPDHHLLVADDGNAVVGVITCVIIPNLTRGLRPYAFLENLVVRPDARGKGIGDSLLSAAKALCEEAGCYKMMLMTGVKANAWYDFYRRNGFNSEDKTAFVQWLRKD